MTLEELHLSLGYTRATLRKYLNQIEKESPKNNCYFLKSEKKLGYLLEIKNAFEFGQYYRDILFNMWPVQFLNQLILHNKVNKAFFPIEFFISDSVLKNKIKDFKQVLAYFSISLKISNSMYYLEGNEANIRRLSEEFFWEFFKGSSWPFKTVEEQAILDKTTQLLQNATRAFSLIDQRRINYSLAIQEVRVKCGELFEVNQYDSSYRSFLNLFITHMQQNKSLFPTEGEFYYFYFWLATKSKYYSYFDTDFNTTKLCSDSMNTYVQLNIRILAFITETLGSLSKENTRIVSNYLICTHMHLLLFNNNYIINNKQLLFSNHKNMVPVINNIIDLIEEEVPLNQEVKSFLTYRYSTILSTIYPPSTFSKKIIISFCTDLEPTIETKLLRILTDYFSDIISVEFFSGVNNVTQPIDLIIHTALNPRIFSDKKVKATKYVDTRFLHNPNLSSLIDLITQFLTDDVIDKGNMS
ncbi:helix-turn-helix domain-containing protein [Enterococcus ureasiticus]|nr:helix-turn-helix domain-containing protein [Enterococcus ureasiticus]